MLIEDLRDAHRWLDELLCDSRLTLESLASREGKTVRSLIFLWRPGDKFFGFWLQLAAKGYDVGTYGRSVSLLPLARLARRLVGNAKGNQKEPTYRASS